MLQRLFVDRLRQAGEDVYCGSAARGRARAVAREGGEDCAHHRAGYRNFGQLEGDGAGVAQDAGADLDQFELQAIASIATRAWAQVS